MSVFQLGGDIPGSLTFDVDVISAISLDIFGFDVGRELEQYDCESAGNQSVELQLLHTENVSTIRCFVSGWIHLGHGQFSLEWPIGQDSQFSKSMGQPTLDIEIHCELMLGNYCRSQQEDKLTTARRVPIHSYQLF